MGALLLTTALCTGMSAGPTFGHDTTSPEPTATTEPTEPQPATAPGETTEPPTTDHPPADEPDPGVVDLRLEAWLDKAGYPIEEEVTVHARVTNVGTATASSPSRSRPWRSTRTMPTRPTTPPR
ncbi:hypothetical protein [Saccharothrix syringae]|uniref:hypothetical protein n=1 Tax=Saccharothrix syringae TaxID=103733 RepID=UPI0012FC5F0F|nr:hypothetical protein [Saccharothrix syringae]